MRACLLEGDFHSPASDEPLQHLDGVTLKVGRKQRLRLESVRRVTHDHPADGNRRQTRVIPERGRRRDFDHTLCAAIPSGDRLPSPPGRPIFEHGGKGRQSHPLQARSPILSRLARWRRLIERGIQAQARNHGHALAHSLKQFKCGETTVGDDNYLTLRQPALDLQDHLPRPGRQFLGCARVPFVVALGRAQGRQHRQRPDPLGPGDVNGQHEREPAQATRFDKMAVRRPNGITVDAFGCDPLASPPLDSVIYGKDERARRHKGIDQQREQDARGRPARPSRTVQDAMVSLESALVAQAHHAQHRGDGALARRKNAADEQHLDVLPDGLGKERGEAYNQACQFEGQREHI